MGVISKRRPVIVVTMQWRAEARVAMLSYEASTGKLVGQYDLHRCRLPPLLARLYQPNLFPLSPLFSQLIFHIVLSAFPTPSQDQPSFSLDLQYWLWED